MCKLWIQGLHLHAPSGTSAPAGPIMAEAFIVTVFLGLLMSPGILITYWVMKRGNTKKVQGLPTYYETPGTTSGSPMHDPSQGD